MIFTIHFGGSNPPIFGLTSISFVLKPFLEALGDGEGCVVGRWGASWRVVDGPPQHSGTDELMICRTRDILIHQVNHAFLGGGFKYVLCSPQFGEVSHFDEHIFQRG